MPVPDDQTFAAPIARSPVEGRIGLSSPAISLEERPFLGKLILRGDDTDKSFLSAAKKHLGVDLPLAPNTTASKGDLQVLWLGPTEWLVRTAPGAETALAQAFTQDFANKPAGVVDVSDYYTVFRLSGPRAREVMSKGCPLDTHSSVFTTAQCAQSLLAKADILLDCVEDGANPAFDLQVRWSMAVYLWDWLASAGAEYAQQ